MLVFAILSEIPFDLAFFGDWFDWRRLNVLFTLSAGIIAMMVLDSDISRDLKVFYVYLIVVVSNYLGFDYFYLGVLQIVCFYIYRSSNFKKFVTVGILNLFYWFRFSFQSAAFLGFLPIYLYKGKLGKRTGLLFYTFYGLHLLIFGLLKKLLL